MPRVYWHNGIVWSSHEVNLGSNPLSLLVVKGGLRGGRREKRKKDVEPIYFEVKIKLVYTYIAIVIKLINN